VVSKLSQVKARRGENCDNFDTLNELKPFERSEDECSMELSRKSIHRNAFKKCRGWITPLLLVALAIPANAGDILRGGAALSNTRTRANSGASAGADVAAQTQANARDRLARTTQALNAMKGLQAQARAAAAGKVKLNNPNKPGQFLPTVRNGLGKGGLQVDPLVPKNLKKPKAGEDPSLWVGANLPRQTTSKDGGKDVTIVQTDQQALLTWKTFNIGKKTTLIFDQSAGKDNRSEWIAFNKINDPSGRPSQILGQIKADGQVYVINQNGIIFGGTSQVNVHTLVASSLPINTNLIANGLLNNPDAQFLFSALALPAGAKGTPSFKPDAPLTADGTIGNVVVEEGALLESPTSAAHVGGRIMLVGPNVENKGTISTPDGQTILAAGLQVGIDAHSSDDASLRGLDVYVGAVVDPKSDKPVTAGVAKNTGLIDAPHADVTMTGKDVRQLGVIDSSTTVDLNGRIDLIASYDAITNIAYDPNNSAKGLPFLSRSTGTVTLGRDSVTRILPDYENTKTIVGSELPLRSRINIEGHSIHFAKDSFTLAPNAEVTVNAGNWYVVPAAQSSNTPLVQFVYPDGQIYMDQGALLDVAGTTGVNAPMSENILKVQLRGAEVANSPLQRTSIFRPADGDNPELTVDLRESGTFNGFNWVGTPLGDLSGFADLIERGVGALTTAGGSVTLRAGDSVVLREGSVVDVSGGWVNYEGGFVQTSRVISGGQLIDIANATPDRVYDGFYTAKFTTSNHPKWGVSETYANPLALFNGHFESSYISGRAGGSIDITAPSVALDGKLAGQTTTGTRQMRNSSGKTDLPTAASLALTFRGTDPEAHGSQVNMPTSPKPPRVVFANTPDQKPADAFALDALGNPLPLRGDRARKFVLSSDLFGESSFGSLTIDNSAGSIFVPADVSLDAGPKGSITMKAMNIDVAGSISAPGGSLDFTTYNISPYDAEILLGDPTSPTFRTPDANRGFGKFTLRSGATLSTAGLLIDDRFTSDSSLERSLVTGGGTISIHGYSANLRSGSVIDVSGGAAVSTKGTVSYGNAGAISILTGQDPKLESVLGGQLKLGATLLGYTGGDVGGSLTIQAPLIRIGAETTDRHEFAIAPDFFNQGGFSKFALIGLGSAPFLPDPFADGSGAVSVGDAFRSYSLNRSLPGLVIEEGTVIAPQVRTWLVDPLGSGSEATLSPTLLDSSLRPTVSLAFTAKGAKDSFSQLPIVRGELVLGKEADLLAGPRGGISLNGDTVDVLGSAHAPGGSISIKGGKSYVLLDATQALNARATVHIGAESVLSTRGEVVLTPDPYGRRRGSVLAGGSIDVFGNVIAEAGSTLDVSGASGILDLLPAELGGSALPDVTSGLNAPLFSRLSIPARVDSDGGSITLTGSEELFVASTLEGAAGGPTALGGSLAVSSGRFYPNNVQSSPLDVTLVVTQSGSVFAPPADGSSPIGHAVRNNTNRLLEGAGGFAFDTRSSRGGAVTARGYFAADQFLEGGFDSLELGGVVSFHGPVKIDARQKLTVATGGVLYANDDVELSAPYVALGTTFLPPLQISDPARTSAFTASGVPFYFRPTTGRGRLIVNADLIDMGNLALRGIRNTRLHAPGGDIRGDGTFVVSGSLLLEAGQIYPASGVSFTLAAYDYKKRNPKEGENPIRFGSITIIGSGDRQLPLSAGGELNVYATKILQGGTLRAPLGTINLGWDGTGDAPKNLITGAAAPITRTLVLGSGSETAVSAVDSGTGEPLLIPYGLVLNGTSWIDPSGMDITTGGVPRKSIHLGADRLITRAGSTIDIRGGGDLYAYRWVEGNGGKQDILASEGSFAVIPGYQANYAPYADFNQTSDAQKGFNPNFDPSTDTPAAGYRNSSLSVGDRVYLEGSDSLAAGTYTLLPARYALLPGAVLVTPKPSTPRGTLALPDGSTLVSGYRFNDLNSSRTTPKIYTQFEVLSSSVMRSRAQYDDYFANTFFTKAANDLGVSRQRLPFDAGHLAFEAGSSLALRGRVSSAPFGEGIGAYIDISSPSDIWITGSGVKPKVGKGDSKPIVLDASLLTSFGAESLLIGGIRTEGDGGTSVTVKTGNLTVANNARSPLSGSEIILAANDTLTLRPRAVVEQSGVMRSDAQTLLLDGDGALLRVSSDSSAQILRSGVSGDTSVAMKIGKGARIAGTSLILDSTYATDLSAKARLIGDFVSLNSGQISLRLNNPGDLQPTDGLVLGGQALRGLQSVQSLSLLSYSSIDIYGQGTFGIDGDLSLHAAEIRGYNTNGGAVTFNANAITLDNLSNGSRPGSSHALDGTLALNAEEISLGTRRVNVDQFATLALNATKDILLDGRGALVAEGNLTATTPGVIAARSATQRIRAGGALQLLAPKGPTQLLADSDLGASLTLQGASVTVTSDIVLPSGLLNLRASQGDITVGGRLDVGGSSQTFYDLVKYTDGGRISVFADNGSVDFQRSSEVSVAAQRGGGNAGSVEIRTPNGSFQIAGKFEGRGGKGGKDASFSLDAGELPQLASVNDLLDKGSFNESRTFRVRHGDVLVGGRTAARHFDLSVDAGSITVSGLIDASGLTGGSISLSASGSLTLLDDARLTVAAKDFDNAGKGGTISLEAGAQTNGVFDTSAMLDLRAGSVIDLGVAANTDTSASLGKFTGTLHLRAPQTASSTDVQMNPIDATILGASSIVVEGYKIFDLTASGGQITNAVKNQVKANGNTFVGPDGSTTASYTAMHDRLLANNAALEGVLTIRPGAEIINRSGNITVGTAATGNNSASNDWNLQSYRFGPKSAPGVLTLRATGNLVFLNALTDGFDIISPTSSATWAAPLLEANPLLPMNAQSWSYRLVAGADLGAASFRRVMPLTALSADMGSLLLGKNAGPGIAPAVGGSWVNALTRSAIAGRFQVIRTGSGDIDIAAGRDVQLLNQFATIYTAGTLLADPAMGGAFDVPILNAATGQSFLGAIQQNPAYPVQYTLGGGNVSIYAQNDIAHYTRDTLGNLIPDSSRQLPTSWLYRRGYIDPATGEFGAAKFGDIASTTWWVDFSNFFEGVGALGGGNVSLVAGHDISNVDAVAPTNARMPKSRPDASKLVELGGGDVVVRADNDIDGGVYYVERGQGILSAGNSIHTNSTRSPSLTIITDEAPYPEETWLPTTLFLGKGGFDVSARGDLTLGPVANPFLLPENYNNTFWYKTYFSTYATTDWVNVASLGGTVTFRENTVLPGSGIGGSTPMLAAWLQNVLLFSPTETGRPSFYQPWLRLDETSVGAFTRVSALQPPTLRATAFSGDINVVGDLTLTPSPRGTVDLAASGAINGLQPQGFTTINGIETASWGSARINLSDASPGALPGITSPFAYQTLVGATPLARRSNDLMLAFIDPFFSESGSLDMVIQTKQSLHAAGLLHKDDPNPVRLYAQDGDISGVTLFSPKAARILAGNDITDIAFYVQNVSEEDVTVVSAGRDIVAYNANSPLRAAATVIGNGLNFGESTLAGDIQISGPGTLEVLAGRNLDLGTGGGNADGTGTGITSVGNARNPYLPFGGARLIIGAGIGFANGLENSKLDFETFISEFIEGDNGTRYLGELASMLGEDSKLAEKLTPEDFSTLPTELRNQLALDLFYLVLRDAGRDHNEEGSLGFGNYDAGFAAIDALFGKGHWKGDINSRARDIRTKNGGDIDIFVPGGGLQLANSTLSATLAPPGIVTESGGNINIFTNDNVDLGIGRIFTLRGGNEVIWSSTGDIAAGASAKTVKSAPPTRVLIDPQSADVKTDLAGLATGGGIGVLATVEGVAPGTVDLIAPVGVVDAGDAGIRASGTVSIAATKVLNASNIAAPTTSGVPSSAPPPAAPPPAPPASNSTAATNNAANDLANQAAKQQNQQTDTPSIFDVEVLGYGGGEGTDSASNAAPRDGA
jgi:filamentous hemagglutinin family protein